MPKRSSKRERRSKALSALGFAGVSLSIASGACASIGEASAKTPPPSQGNELFLGEEELFDVSLATFYVFDKENAGAPPLAQQLRLARGGCGGGCGGCRCAGCGGCRCGGFFFGGCVGCVACGGCTGCAPSCWVWSPGWGWVYSCTPPAIVTTPPAIVTPPPAVPLPTK
jgi:hypothetical protein